MIQVSPEKNRMGSKRNTGKKRRTPEKAGEHRKNEELSKHRKKEENSGKVWCFFENTRKRKKLRKKLVNTKKESLLIKSQVFFEDNFKNLI